MRNKDRMAQLLDTAEASGEEERDTRALRMAVSVPPEALAGLPESAGAWHETPEEVEQALAWGEHKGRLVAWVRDAMRRRLTNAERRCIELHFFEGLSFREAAARTGSNASSMHRGLRRALKKLREAAETDPETAPLMRPKRRQ